MTAPTDDPAPGIAVAGSDLHYATLYYPPATRRLLICGEQLRVTVCDIPSGCSDRGVAHLKLTWWRDEADRMRHGDARHPLSLALLDTAPNAVLFADALLELVDGVTAGLQERPETTAAGVMDNLAARQDRFLRALFEASTPSTADEACIGLLHMVELARWLRDYRNQRRGGQFLIDAETLTSHGLDQARARETLDGTTLEPLMRTVFAHLAATLESAIGGISRAARTRHRFAIVQARIAARALTLTLEDGCRVLEHRIDVMPVEKLYLAWRTRWFG